MLTRCCCIRDCQAAEAEAAKERAAKLQSALDQIEAAMNGGMWRDSAGAGEPQSLPHGDQPTEEGGEHASPSKAKDRDVGVSLLLGSLSRLKRELSHARGAKERVCMHGVFAAVHQRPCVLTLRAHRVA